MFHLRLRTHLTNQYVLLVTLVSYVNETLYLLRNLPFFKIHVNHFMAQDNSPCSNVISKCMLWVRTRQINRKLRSVSELPAEEAERLLDTAYVSAADGEEV